jgi:hypothetical protein
LALTCPAYATDLTGAWATDTAACGKVFVTKGNKPSFRQNSEMYGSGFIMEGRRIRGRTASCTATKDRRGERRRAHDCFMRNGHHVFERTVER